MEFEQLLKLIKTVSDSAITNLEYEKDGEKIVLQKENGQIAAMPMTVVPQVQPAVMAAAAPVQEVTAPEPEGKIVKSPLVGTFYVAPAEDAEPFVQVGDTVKKGQTLAIVEAMKLMNDIECEYDGTIAEVFVQNGEAVEYGQPLFRVM